MDRPRTATAAFEPLRTTLQTDPPGIPLTLDGASIHTPATFQWTAGSVHEVAAPETVGDGPDAPLLAFDGWTDLRPRVHSFSIARDAFVPDLTARFIDTLRQVAVPAGGARRVATTGASDAPRLAALTLSPAAGEATPALQLVRGTVNGTTTSELVLAASAPREWTSSYVEQSVDGANGRVRVALFNPGAEEARVGLLLRDEGGRSLAARTDALVVPPGAHVTARLDEVLPLPAAFQALLTLVADRPIVTGVHEHHGNLRSATYRYDPLLLARFTQGDAGVPLDARLQAVLLTPGTRHQVVLVNTGFSGLTGSVAFEDEAGTPLALALDSGDATGAAYDLPPGGWLRLEFPTPPGPDAAPLRTARVRVTPSPGQPAPAVQLAERQTIPAADGAAAVLPRAVPPSAVGRAFRLPAEPSARETGAVLTNVAPVPATVEVRAVDESGGDAGIASLTVPAGGQVAVSTSQVLAGASPSFAGTVTLASDIPLYAVGWLRLVNERSEEIVAGFPLLADGEPAAAFPLAMDGDSWRSEWWLFNPSAAEARTELTFRGADGRRVFFPFE
jgi:hypothetical protein